MTQHTLWEYPPAAMLLYWLITHASDEGDVFISYRELSKHLNLSQRTMRRCAAHLIALELITLEVSEKGVMFHTRAAQVPHKSPTPNKSHAALTHDNHESIHSISTSIVQQMPHAYPISAAPLMPAEHLPNAIASFIGVYVKAFQARYGDATRPDLRGKVVGQIKTLLKSVPLLRASSLIQTYLQMDTPWFVTKCHDFTTFMENLNPIGIAFDTGKSSPAGYDAARVKRMIEEDEAKRQREEEGGEA